MNFENLYRAGVNEMCHNVPHLKLKYETFKYFFYF